MQIDTRLPGWEPTLEAAFVLPCETIGLDELFVDG